MTTHVLMVTDMSGSMLELAEDVRGGYNTYLDSLAGQGGDFRITATLFDTELVSLCVDAALADVPRLDRGNYRPRGFTALLDAVGRTIGEFEHRKPVLGDDDKVLVVVQTDGRENASKEFGFAAVKRLLDERCCEGGKWAVLYIGAGPDTWAQAAAMGVRADGYVNTSRSRGATHSTYEAMSGATVAFAGGQSVAQTSRIVRDATKDK